MSSWIKISGTQTGEFNLGFNGAKLKNDGGNLAVKTATDSAHAAVTAANVVVIDDATGFSVDIRTSPAQLANYQFTLPPNVGVSGQFLQTAGNGSYTWETAVQPGQLMTETFSAITSQVGFTLANSPTGDVTFAINGAVTATDAATVAGTLVTYVPAQNSGYVLTAGDQITVSYLYGTTAAGDLNSLSDVDVISPTNGSALIYNSVTQKWVVGAGITDPTALTSGASNVSIPAASGNVNVSVSGVANILTITTAGGNVTGNLDITDTLTSVNANISGNIVAGNILVPPSGVVDTFDLRVANDAIITGNLNVLGNLNTTNTNSYAVVGPIFEFGGLDPNNNPLSINDGMDRGMLLDYFDSSFKQSFFGWDNANGRFEAGAQVSNVNNVITTAVFANIKAHTFIGNVEGGNISGNIIGNVTGNLVNGTSNVVIPSAGGDILFTAGGVNELTVTPTGVNVAGNLSVGLHADVAGNLTVVGHTTLGAVANVHITGGSNGQVLTTNGVGNLTWANLSVKEVVNGNSNIIVGANSTVSISANGIANVFTIDQSGANLTGNLTATGVTRLNVIGNVKINGGANGQVITTDGAGNLSFTTPIIANLNNGTSNVRVFANSNVTTSVNGVANVFTVTQTGANIVGTANVLGNLSSGNANVNGNLTVTSNATITGNSLVSGTGTITGTLEVGGNASLLSNLAVTGSAVISANANIAGDLRVTADAYFSAVANVHIPGGTSGQLLVTDGTGNLSWSTVNTALKIQDEGNVVALTANTINFVGAEITSSGVGNVVTVNVTPGNISNINNGTSNVMIGAANDVVVTSVNGVANIWTVTQNGGELVGNLSVTGVTTLTTPANLKITGGNVGQVLTTDGTGNLTWAAAGGAITIRDEGNVLTNAAAILNFTGAGVTAGLLGNVVTINVPGAGSSQPSVEFVALADGVNQAFNDPAIFNLVSNTQSQVYVNGVLARSTDYTISGTTLTFTRYLSTGDEITAAPVTVLTSVPQSAIASGSSGVVVAANANVGVSVNGVADVAVFSDTGANITGDLAVTGNVTVGANLAVTGLATFSDVANVSIGGGTSGQVLSTDGAGVLSWVTQSGGGGGTVTPVPTIEFVATANGINQAFTNANIALILSNAQCSAYVNGSLATVADFTVSGTTLTFSRYINTGDVISVAAFGVTNMAVTGAGGATTQLQFNQAGNLRGISSATYDGTKLTLGSNAQVKITGGTSGQALVTDGSGNLSWTTASAIAGGSDTELQFNDGGVITGIPTVTYDGANLSLGAVGNVKMTGGTVGQSLVTDGTGNLSFGGALLGSWINAGPVVVGAVTTAPTKGTPINDFVRYRKIAPKEYEVQIMYSQTTAGSAGSGDYLYTLPAGLQFDFTSPGQKFTTAASTTATSPSSLSFAIPGGSVGTISQGGFAVPVTVVPYSATQFRLLSAFGWGSTPTISSIFYISSGYFALTDSTNTLNVNIRFIATV